jgi:hypothetical protein
VLPDVFHARIRVVAAKTGRFYGRHMVAGDIYTIAGDGSGLFSGDGGPATSASMGPLQVTAGPGGEMLLIDFTSNRIRVIGGVTTARPPPWRAAGIEPLFIGG